MRAAVRSAFPLFTQSFEGHLLSFYRDVYDLVSIGDGLLADPISLIAGLEFEIDGVPCGWSDVTRAWIAVKTSKIYAGNGGKAREFAELTRVRATERTIAHLVDVKLSQCEIVMRRLFPEWDEWPSDPQLACLSMCWAMGPARISLSYPRFIAACRARDWNTAGDECHMSELGQNESFVRRNATNRALFRSSAAGGDPETLSWKAAA